MADERLDLRARCVEAVEQIKSDWEGGLPAAAAANSAASSTTTQDGRRRPLVSSAPSSAGPAACQDPLVESVQRLASDLLWQCRDGPLVAATTDPDDCEMRTTVAEKRGDNNAVPSTQQLQQQLLLLLRRLDGILAAAYSRFYSYLPDGPPYWLRQLYTDASILKFSLLFLAPAVATQPDGFGERRKGPHDHVYKPSGDNDDELSRLTEPLDLALILAGGAGEDRGSRWIAETFSLLEGAPTACVRLEGSDDGATMVGGGLDRWAASVPFSSREPFTPPVSSPIRRTGPVSMESFQRYLDRPADRALGPEPVVLSGLLESWPARTTRPWDRPDYLLSRTLGGRRLVPVEVGRSYVDDDWSQKLVSFGEFVRTHIHVDPSTATSAPSSTTATTAYLAQHPLLTQLPTLRADVLTPDLCYTAPPGHPTDSSQDQPELDGPRLNAWFGPPGTITPLHTDPYHNLLAQVVGRKYVRLYGPRESPRMRSRGREGEGEGAVNMANTSLWDVGAQEGWDGNGGNSSPSSFFAHIPFVDCILEPGDTLYIPIGWWHYVRALSVSFSVSFWWN